MHGIHTIRYNDESFIYNNNLCAFPLHVLRDMVTGDNPKTLGELEEIFRGMQPALINGNNGIIRTVSAGRPYCFERTPINIEGTDYYVRREWSAGEDQRDISIPEFMRKCVQDGFINGQNTSFSRRNAPADFLTPSIQHIDETWDNNENRDAPPENRVERNNNVDRKMNSIVKKLEKCKQIILTGAPGTGKTYMAQKIAQQLVFGVGDDGRLKDRNAFSEEEKEKFKRQVRFCQFHPSYDYTDFVEGLRPDENGDNANIGFSLQDGVFKSFCRDAKTCCVYDDNKYVEDNSQKFVFIIDEINRGDLSKIFGELFFAIDPGYRGEQGRVITQYANMIPEGDEFKKGFYVPENVYIIGTMNDIDRSVESMDFAMRRRFTWVEIKAEESKCIIQAVKGDAGDFISEAEERMDYLNAEIIKQEYQLGAAYQIGGAYFKKIELYSDEPATAFELLWDHHLYNVLHEYLRGTPRIEEHLAKLKAAYDEPVSRPIPQAQVAIQQ